MSDIINLNEQFQLENLLEKDKFCPVFRGSHTIHTFYQNDVKYYFKEMPVRELIYELVALEIGKLVGIDILDLNVATLNDSYGTLSKSYQQSNDKKCLFSTIMQDYFENTLEDDDHFFDFTAMKSLNNLEDIWFALEEKYKDPKTVAAIMDSITDIFCFDMVTGQSDRHLDNLEILEQNNYSRLAPCFDNSSIYGGHKSLLGLDYDDFFNSTEEEKLSKFLTVSASDYSNKFITMHNTLKQVGIHSILDIVTQEYHIPVSSEVRQDLVAGYCYQDNLIEGCISKYQQNHKSK